ncbi:MAG: dihydrofolate reductase family protein [Bryobacteraceae bacterium]
MRKVILGVGISLDGYIARPDGAVDFLFMPKDFSMAEFLASVDISIMGRKTLEAARRLGAKFDSPAANYVFSRSEAAGARDGVTFVNEPPAVLIERLRKQPGKHIWLMGGGELAREFLIADLVDEVHLGIVPVLLGAGIPLFPSGFQQRNFKLIENKTYSQGLIALKYARE